MTVDPTAPDRLAHARAKIAEEMRVTMADFLVHVRDAKATMPDDSVVYVFDKPTREAGSAA